MNCNGVNHEDGLIIFSFTENDFIKDISTGQQSKLDILLKSKWNQAKNKGVFNYKISEDSEPVKRLEGEHEFVAQLNEARGSLRRKPHEMTSLNMPFEKDKFNFTKITKNEVLFEVVNQQTCDEATVIINSSPFEFGNSLIVPRLLDCRPQKCTSDSLRLAICLVALNGDGKLKAGFNSLGSMASVNHQHWHVYYYKEKIKIEELPIENNLLMNWPIQAVVYQIEELTIDSINKIVDKISNIIDHCHQAEIGYNLFITRSKDNLKVFLWTRKPVFGVKDNLVNAAFVEFAGLFVCKTKQLFDRINQEFCIEILESIETKINDIKHLIL